MSPLELAHHHNIAEMRLHIVYAVFWALVFPIPCAWLARRCWRTAKATTDDTEELNAASLAAAAMACIIGGTLAGVLHADEAITYSIASSYHDAVDAAQIEQRAEVRVRQ